MGGIPDRQLLVMTVVLSALAVVVTLVSSGGDWLVALISLPFFMTVSFWSLRISRWLGKRVGPKPPELPEPTITAPTPPTSERPEHAQRRRERRRRGRR